MTQKITKLVRVDEEVIKELDRRKTHHSISWNQVLRDILGLK